MTTAVKIEGISKNIGKKLVIDDVTFEIKQGEIFGLLGPNGAGKTTIMRIITGLIKPTSGNIAIDGLELSKHHENALAKVGAIIESPDLYKHLSGLRNLRIMANMSRDVDEERIKKMVEFVGLSGRIKEKVGKYSLGMRQRLGIAAALLSNPKVLILDEPLNGLDPDGVKEMRETFIKLAHEQNVCIILSSHILSEMELVCDRFAIIDQGKLIETKELDETNGELEKPYQIEFLQKVNETKLTEILHLLDLVPQAIAEQGITVFGSKENISELIRALIQSGIDIVSVVPKKKSLEDYFIKRVGEQSK